MKYSFMKKHLNALLLITFFFISIFLAFNTTFSDFIQNNFKLNQRWVVSKISSSIFAQDTSFEILKIREKNNIYLEIYKSLPTGASHFLNKISLEQRFDGYFVFNNLSTNLALNDMDNDKVPEILAPTFDQSMTPRLNVVKYNPDSQSFFLMLSPPEFN